MKSLKGKLLIALPDLEDDNFFRTVILILHHDQFGASGVVLNRPSQTRVIDILPKLELDNDPALPLLSKTLHVGGPVDGPLILLHDAADLSQESILDDLHMSTQRSLLEALLDREDGQLKIFNRYSGWAWGQLDNEVQCGGWFVIDARSDHVFGDSESLWKRVCQELGSDVSKLLSADLGDQGPPDPGLN